MVAVSRIVTPPSPKMTSRSGTTVWNRTVTVALTWEPGGQGAAAPAGGVQVTDVGLVDVTPPAASTDVICVMAGAEVNAAPLGGVAEPGRAPSRAASAVRATVRNRRLISMIPNRRMRSAGTTAMNSKIADPRSSRPGLRWFAIGVWTGPRAEAPSSNFLRCARNGAENVRERGTDCRPEPGQSDGNDGGNEHAGPGHVLHDLGTLLVSNQTLQNDPQSFELNHVLSF